jgi:inhibitor of Bruton tyrosine kinase
LDKAVQDNQLGFLPFARSGRANAELLKRNPELTERLERSRRAKVDSIMLSNKYADSERRASSSFRAQSLEEVATSPGKPPRIRRKSKGDARSDGSHSAEATPQLKGKSSAEFLFDMSDDDDDGGDEELEYLDENQPRKTYNDVTKMKVSSPIIQPATKSHAEDLPASPALSIDSTTTPPVFHDHSRPWGSTSIVTDKLGLKDIMAQASSDRQSAITLAIAAQGEAKSVSRVAGTFASKMSQKERKKLQHQASSTPVKTSQQDDRKPGQERPSSRSPWTIPSPKPVAARLRSSESVTPQSSPLPMPPIRTPSTPQLTMRQTLAKNGPASKQKTETLSSVSDRSSQPQPNRSVSGSSVAPSNPTTKFAASTAAISPHSVRHIPFAPISQPTSPENRSMLEILSQQQAEKDIFHDALTGPKRSLQDIQIEQEFQEWWDQESKRVIEEDVRNKREQARRTRAEKGRGRGRRGRDGRGAKASGSKVKDPDIEAAGGAKPSAQALPKMESEGDQDPLPRFTKEATATPPTGPALRRNPGPERMNGKARGGKNPVGTASGRGRGKGELPT